MSTILAIVEKGSKIIATASYFDISQSTLANHVHGKILKRKMRPSIILSFSEENALDEYISKMQDYEYILSIEQVRLKGCKNKARKNSIL